MVIVALGGSVVVIGAAVSGRDVGVALAGAAVLALALSAALWWAYFRDEPRIEAAMEAVPEPDRPRAALVGFGAAHAVLLLGVV